MSDAAEVNEGGVPAAEEAAPPAVEDAWPISRDAPAPEPPAEAPPAPEPKAGQRLLSLDAFRGLTIVGMLMVNNMVLDTATPDQLQHAPWAGGIHLADLVFPWFLYIVGVALPYSAASHRRKGGGWLSYAGKAVRRAVLLVLLGCLIASSLVKRPVFELGVLQIIGLAYLLAALFIWLPAGGRLALAALLLAGHWWALRFLHLPGGPAGLLSETENLVAHVNRTYLAQYHLAGLMSVVPTGAMVLMGSAFGDALRSKWTPWRKVAALAAGGAILCAVGWVWNMDLPFSKTLWTASYITATAGLGAITLAAFYVLVDMNRWGMWSFPLVVFGSNAILAYVMPILVKVMILMEWRWRMPDGTNLPLVQAYQHYLFDHAGRIHGGWLYTASYIALWWVVLLLFYRKRIFLRV